MTGFVERASQGTVAFGGLNVGGYDITAADAAKLDALGASAYPVVVEAVTFTETAGAGVWTGTISLPAESYIIDVQVHGIALWTSQTSATLIVGDGTDDNGFYLATDLKATDLLAGEALTIEHPGGLAGAYIASEQRVLYSAAARDVIGVITKVGSSGTAGRTRLVVIYAAGVSAVAATKV